MLINLQRKCCDCPCSLSTEDNKIFSICPQLCDIDDAFKGYFYIDKELECGCEDPFLTYQFECVDCSYCNEEEEVEVVTLCPCGDLDYGFPCCKDPGFAPPELSTDNTTDSPIITQINPYVYPRPENIYNVYDTDENLIKTCVNKNCTFYIENGVLVYSSLENEAKIEKCGCCCMLKDTQGNRIVAEPKCPKLCPNSNEDPTNIEDYVYYVNADYECCQGILKAGCYSQCEDGSLPKNYCKCCDEENGETWGPCCGPGGPEPETENGEEDWPGQDLGCPNCWWSQPCFAYYNNICPASPDPNSVCVKNDLNDDANFACPKREILYFFDRNYGNFFNTDVSGCC